MKLLYGERYTVDTADTITYLTVDPAGGTAPQDAGPRTDKWGFAVVSVTTDSKWFVRDLFAQHMNEEMFMAKLWELDALWHPYRIGIEKTQHLMAYVRMDFSRRNRSLPIIDLQSKGRRKERRIMALSAMLPNMYFSSKIAAGVQHHMRRWYTEQEHGDDDLDALAYMIDIAKAPTLSMIAENRRMQEEADTQEALARLPANQRPEWEAWLKYEHRLRHGNSLSDEMQEMYDY
jgi:hypothetical protein